MSRGRDRRKREDPAVDPVVAVVLTAALPDHHEGSAGAGGHLRIRLIIGDILIEPDLRTERSTVRVVKPAEDVPTPIGRIATFLPGHEEVPGGVRGHLLKTGEPDFRIAP